MEYSGLRDTGLGTLSQTVWETECEWEGVVQGEEWIGWKCRGWNSSVPHQRCVALPLVPGRVSHSLQVSPCREWTISPLNVFATLSEFIPSSLPPWSTRIGVPPISLQRVQTLNPSPMPATGLNCPTGRNEMTVEPPRTPLPGLV